MTTKADGEPAQHPGRLEPTKPAMPDVVRHLSERLAGGPQDAAVLRAELEAAGATVKQVRLARTKLGLTISRTGFGAELKSFWAMPTFEAAPLPAVTAKAATVAETARVSHGIDEEVATPELHSAAKGAQSCSAGPAVSPRHAARTASSASAGCRDPGAAAFGR